MRSVVTRCYDVTVVEGIIKKEYFCPAEWKFSFWCMRRHYHCVLNFLSRFRYTQKYAFFANYLGGGQKCGKNG